MNYKYKKFYYNGSTIQFLLRHTPDYGAKTFGAKTIGGEKFGALFKLHSRNLSTLLSAYTQRSDSSCIRGE
jgi:hypothetical protein